MISLLTPSRHFSPYQLRDLQVWVEAARVSVPASYQSLLQALGASAVWRLDEASGAFLDSSGNGRHLLLNGSLLYQQLGPLPLGEFPYGIVGFTTNDYLSITDSAFNTAGAFTVGGWIGGGSVSAPIITKDDTTRSWSIAYAETGVTGPNPGPLNFTVWNGSTSYTVSSNANYTGGATSYVHAVCVYDPSAGLFIYTSGVLDSSAVSFPASINSSSSPLVIGRRFNLPQVAWPSSTSGVFYVNRALSATEIQSLYSGMVWALQTPPNNAFSSAIVTQSTTTRRPRVTYTGVDRTVLGISNTSSPSLGYTVTPGLPISTNDFSVVVTFYSLSTFRRLYDLEGPSSTRTSANPLSLIDVEFGGTISGTAYSGVPTPITGSTPVTLGVSVFPDGSSMVWNGYRRGYRRAVLGGVLPNGATATFLNFLTTTFQSNNTTNGVVRDYILTGKAISPSDADRLTHYLHYRAGLRSLNLPVRSLNMLYVGDDYTIGSTISSATYADLSSQSLNSSWVVSNYNLGRTGGTLGAINTTLPDPEAYYDPTVPNVCVVWLGSVDIASGITAATTYSRLVTFCQARRSLGWKVLVCTMIPRNGTSDVATTEAQRQAYNALIIANYASFADRLVDFTTNANFDNISDTNGGVYAADKVTVTQSGHQSLSVIVTTIVNALLA